MKKTLRLNSPHQMKHFNINIDFLLARISVNANFLSLQPEYDILSLLFQIRN